jgi:hypothetical protein
MLRHSCFVFAFSKITISVLFTYEPLLLFPLDAAKYERKRFASQASITSVSKYSFPFCLFVLGIKLDTGGIFQLYAPLRSMFRLVRLRSSNIQPRGENENEEASPCLILWQLDHARRLHNPTIEPYRKCHNNGHRPSQADPRLDL